MKIVTALALRWRVRLDSIDELQAIAFARELLDEEPTAALSPAPDPSGEA